jgi:RNA polymerase sigma-70 factor (ECF subfamily)
MAIRDPGWMTLRIALSMIDVNRRQPIRRTPGPTGRTASLPAGLLACRLLAPRQFAIRPPASIQGAMRSQSDLSTLDAQIRDIAAVARFQDRAAFARLFDHFGPRVKAYLLRLGADKGQAEDLTQEVMLTVWRKAPAYEAKLASPATWIFTIARNRRIDALRRDRRGKLDPDDPALLPEADALPDTALEAGRWEKKLAAAIGGLPPEQAQMLKLAYFEDRSHGDIAQSLRLPLGTVKSRLRLAVARLRSIFETER